MCDYLRVGYGRFVPRLLKFIIDCQVLTGRGIVDPLTVSLKKQATNKYTY
jgi:hypothetical protein